jgi:hypothetical protein
MRTVTQTKSEPGRIGEYHSQGIIWELGKTKPVITDFGGIAFFS